MNRKTIQQQEEEAENGNRPWTDTIGTHGVLLAIIMLLGPFTVVHGLIMLMIIYIRDNKFTHLKVDFQRMGYVWIANGLFWSLLMTVMVL